ncbi:hypothetical protein SEVIR_7G072900v4 [Setaria viridis]|uniref:Cell number regulator 6 n=1 Tax=Setaria viridis TaxID=4556 RepID=A0A4U6TPQ9_SETVI|nr:cell number regulator 6-like [Setaria viridis]TKW03892.1 hypothetical protein SEVIR_7G072900v2 [Setaria viridis]
MAGAADAEPSHGRRRYVKLGKEEKDGDAPVAGAEDIRPGELNQAVQFKVRKCDVCWQELPPGYQLPADEPWATGIFGCAEDPQSCWTGLLCPCVLFGRNAEALDGIPWTRRCACHAVCVGGGTALAILTLTGVLNGVLDPHLSYLIGEGLLSCWIISCACLSSPRENLQKKYHLKDSPCNPWLVHGTLHCCAICQEHRERKGRLDAQSVAPATIMNPPPVQEMSMAEIGPSASAPESEAPETAHGYAEVEVIPL